MTNETALAIIGLIVAILLFVEIGERRFVRSERKRLGRGGES